MEQPFLRSKKFIIGAITFAILAGVLFVSIEVVRSGRKATEVTEVTKATEVSEATVVHIPLPDEVRGIYWTAVTAATKRADALIAYMLKSGLNTAVIDLKMDNGQIAFSPHDASLAPYVMKKPAIHNLDALLAKLADDHIYRIARIVVMRDSAFASVQSKSAFRSSNGGLWRDKTGSLWLDPSSPDVALYALALGREAYARGFDEVQFDYVRFASDGSISSIRYPVYDGKQLKVDVMKKFFATVGELLQKEKIPVSFDVFGLTCMTNDGLGVGQRLTDILPNTDFISPMTYPSHYANGFQGFANPAMHPYDVVKISLDHGAKLLEVTEAAQVIRKQFRPWIQDFDIGAVYTHDKIESEIKATRDAGASGFLIWNARNVYEPARYLK